MPGKVPPPSNQKKKGKSLKEKRAEKRAKHASHDHDSIRHLSQPQ